MRLPGSLRARDEGMQIGEPLRTFIVEPLELPVGEPATVEPEPEPAVPQPEAERVPVAP